MATHDSAALTQSHARLLALAAHELRTPLSVVGGYLRMLQRDPESPLSDRHRTMVEEADKACADVVALVSQLRDIGVLDEGAELVRESVNVFELMHAVGAAAIEAADRGVRLAVHGPIHGALVHGNRSRLQQTFATLARVVLREQRDSTLVVADCRLTLDDSRDAVMVVIAKGGDVDAALAAAPAPVDETRGGLGLALPIARRVIERHGGRVWSPASADGTAAARAAILVAIPLAQ